MKEIKSPWFTSEELRLYDKLDEAQKQRELNTKRKRGTMETVSMILVPAVMAFSVIALLLSWILEAKGLIASEEGELARNIVKGIVFNIAVVGLQLLRAWLPFDETESAYLNTYVVFSLFISYLSAF